MQLITSFSYNEIKYVHNFLIKFKVNKCKWYMINMNHPKKKISN